MIARSPLEVVGWGSVAAVASRPHEPATIEQFANAMVALRLWEGQNTAAEHRHERRGLGAPTPTGYGVSSGGPGIRVPLRSVPWH